MLPKKILGSMGSALNKAASLRRRRHIWVTLQIFVSLLFLVLCFRNFAWGRFVSQIRAIPLWFYGVTLLLACFCQFLYALKWYLILRSMGHTPGYLNLVRVIYIGFFFANFAPSTFGQDFIRVYYLGKDKGYLEMGLSVFLDRFFGLFSLIFVALVLSWSISVNLPLLPAIRNVLTGLFAVFAFALLMARLPIERGLYPLKARLPRTGLWIDKLEKGLRCGRNAGNSLRLIPASIALILVIFLIMAVIYSQFFVLISDIRIPLPQIMMAIMVITLFSTIPIAMNGIGLREHAHYLLLSSMGLSREVCVGTSLIMFSFLLAFSLVGFGLWLCSRRPAKTRNRIKPAPPICGKGPSGLPQVPPERLPTIEGA